MPENTIQSSLWTLAQNKIPKGKTMKKETTFFEHTHIAEVSQLLFDPYTTSIDHLTDTDILDSGDEISPAVNNHAALSNLEDHEWFSEESSMISFEDLEESTDTTQTTSYDDSAVDECFAPKLTDIEMLLSDSGSMEDCLDESDGFVAIEI
ncbi:hypothetical protein N7462_009347 [Penicillium macrosclerotiorum]|uniref:uncharacterized protein n=1 Tax=Penicillium macrosclerotiorum TaxID=303699 RepID=UPI00254767EE|nr:uncharacterized protein N7462_009347 [Penicillium macrosclerotiorum]KAJ5673908.1 hypothetical protein N7462_009347 [Penicillium macrosclerotiorum]